MVEIAKRFFLGVDPGLSGGFGLVPQWGDPSAAIAFKQQQTERDIADFFETWADSIIFAMIEKVHSMPKQGVASSFKFGMSYGFLRGLLIGFKIPFEEVTPQRWQKRLQCFTHGDKRISKARAQQMWPELKITHSTADALLISEYCRQEKEF